MITLTWVIYALVAYITWYLVSRLGLFGAWLYSKPSTLTAKHYIVLGIGLLPIVLEVVSTILVTFAIAFGIETNDRHSH